MLGDALVSRNRQQLNITLQRRIRWNHAAKDIQDVSHLSFKRIEYLHTERLEVRHIAAHYL
jgi:hypothetical protein